MARNVSTLLRVVVMLFVVQLALAAKKDNIIAVGGKDVKLVCDVEMASPPHVRWSDLVYNEDRAPADITDETGSLNSVHSNGVNFDLDTSTNVLTIHNFQKEGSGKYFCTSTVDSKEIAKEFDISFIEPPTCVGEKELKADDLLSLDCSASSVGSLSPKLMWYRGETLVESREGTDMMMMMKTMEKDAVPQDDGVTYTCRMEIENLVEECSIKLSVKFPASKVIIDELKKQYMVGDKISCSGDGNPTPEAKWSTDSEEANDEAISGNVLTILEDLVGKTVTYTCTLSNDLGGESGLLKDTFTFSVVEAAKASTESSKTAGVVIGVIIVIIVIVAIIVAVVCYRRSRSPSKDSKSIPQDDIESKRQMDTKGGDNSVSVECEKKAGGGGGATETSVNHVEQEADKEEDPKLTEETPLNNDNTKNDDDDVSKPPLDEEEEKEEKEVKTEDGSINNKADPRA